MRLSIIATTLALGILWGLTMFLVAVGNMKCADGYGVAFLNVMSSIYPGYVVEPTWRSVWIATGYGVVDGAVGGLLFSILYNVFTCCCGGCSTCCKKEEVKPAA